MIDNVFIAWSGNQELAIEIKAKLDANDCLCFVGGNYRKNPAIIDFNSTDRGAINSTVRNQMNYCNQAIILMQKKDELTQISGNLCFELGYLVSKYAPSSIHLFYIDIESSADKAIPSDLHGSWGTPISTTGKNTKQIAEEIVTFFLLNKKVDLYESKLLEVNYYRHTDYALDVHLKNPICSHFELAKRLLFFVQSAFIYQEWNDFEHKCEELRKALIRKEIQSKELRIALDYTLLTFELFDKAIPDEVDGRIIMKGIDFRRMLKEYKALMSVLCTEKRNEGFDISSVTIGEDIEPGESKDEFRKWLIVQLQQHTTFLYLTFFKSLSTEEIKTSYIKNHLNDAIKIGRKAAENLVKIKEFSSNDNYAVLLLGYIYRNLSSFYNICEESSLAIEYQELSYIMRRELYYDSIHDSLWNVELQNYIALEYFLQKLENIDSINDPYDRNDVIEEIQQYIRKTKKYKFYKMLMFSQLVELFEKKRFIKPEENE